MAEEAYTYELYGATNPDGVSERAYGWWRGDGPTLLWANIVWVLVIIGWTAAWMVILPHTIIVNTVHDNLSLLKQNDFAEGSGKYFAFSYMWLEPSQLIPKGRAFLLFVCMSGKWCFTAAVQTVGGTLALKVSKPCYIGQIFLNLLLLRKESFGVRKQPYSAAFAPLLFQGISFLLTICRAPFSTY